MHLPPFQGFTTIYIVRKVIAAPVRPEGRHSDHIGLLELTASRVL